MSIDSAISKEYRLVLDLIDAIPLAENIKNALEVTIQKVCDATGWAAGDSFLFDDVQNELVAVAFYSCKSGKEIDAFADVSKNIKFNIGVGLPGMVAQHKKTISLNPLKDDGSFPRFKYAKAAGINSCVGIPVLADGALLAVLNFYINYYKPEDKQYIDIVSTVSKHIGLVLLQKKNADALSSSEKRFKSLIETSPDAVFLASGSGIIVEINHAAENIFGYSRKELVGAKIERIMPERFREAHREGIKRYLQTKEAKVIGKTVELFGLHKTGREFPIELSLGTWKIDSDTFFSGIIRDISDRKNVQKEIVDANAELERSNSDLEHFAFIASHDLKEPLRMISSYVQILNRRLHNNLDDESKEFMGYIKDGTFRMQELINDLLEYSRIGRTTMEIIEVDINEIIEIVKKNLHSNIEETNAIITSDKLPTIYGYKIQLTSLFQNLIENALKFKNDAEPQINITATDIGNHWKFIVKDNGIGFNQEYSESIFQIFKRLHHASQYSGTGLGLAMVKKIVGLHKGEISATSELGKGSAFIFTLSKSIKELQKM